MRILLIIMILMLGPVLASDDKSMQDLFQKYDQVMDQKKIELIDEVFSQKFIRESGGKNELIEKIKSLPVTNNKSMKLSRPTWRKGLKGNMYFAKVKEVSANKSKTDLHETEFIIVKEDGKLKIEGTLGDGN